MGPQLHLIKPTFSGGEYAPSMYGRVDVARYASGAKKLLNMIVHTHGGISNRPGWHYVARKKYGNTKKCRVKAFQFSSTQNYMLEFGDYYIRFCTNGGQVIVSSASAWLTTTSYVQGNYVSNSGTIYYCLVAHTSGTFATDLAAGKWTAQTIYEIPSPYSENDLAQLTFTQSADVLFMFHPNYQTRQLNRLGATNWTITKYNFLYGPYQTPNTTTSFTITPSGTTGSVTLTASQALFQSTHIGALFNINHYVAEQSVSSSLASVAASSSITCGGTWRIITHGTWAGTIAVQKSTDGGSTWTNIRSFSSASDFNANTFGTEDMSNNAPTFLVRLNMSAYTSGTCSFTLTADAFRNVGHAMITAYASATSVTATVTKTLGGTSATSDWAEGSWSDYRGWPAVGEFNQDRFVTANTANEPQTLWQTKASNYYDYSRNSPIIDSDGITTNIPARQLNGVNGLVPLTQLIALTSSSEWGIGAVDTVMSPLTITQKVYGFNGSIGIKPVIIKNRAIYVQFYGSVILDLGYELLSNTFTGSELSILANHLFTGYSITDMCYQQYPDSLVWAVRDDGHLLSMTYLREQEVLAWTQHETLGDVESVDSIPGSGYSQVWLSVNRSGTDGFIEYMDSRMASTDPKDQFFVDAGIIYNSPKTITGATKANPCVVTVTGHGYSEGDLVDIDDVVGMTQLNGNRYQVHVLTADTFSLKDARTAAAIDSTSYTTYTSGGTSSKCATIITGLGHLEGYNVSVLADGNVVASPNNSDYPVLTVSSGQITIPEPASKVIVGLPYTSDVETLNIETILPDGTMQGRKIRVSIITLRLNQSRGGFMGPSFDDLREIADNFRTNYDTPLDLFTGDLKHTLTGGYTDGGTMCIRQVDPLPITVLALMPIISVGGTPAR